jgi:hypothetical protein
VAAGVGGCGAGGGTGNGCGGGDGVGGSGRGSGFVGPCCKYVFTTFLLAQQNQYVRYACFSTAALEILSVVMIGWTAGTATSSCCYVQPVAEHLRYVSRRTARSRDVLGRVSVAQTCASDSTSSGSR